MTSEVSLLASAEVHALTNATAGALRAAADTIRDGGATLYAADLLPADPRDGWAVGGQTDGIVVSPVTRGRLAAAIDEVSRRAYRDNVPFVGTWIADGAAHVDSVRVVPSLPAALAMAAELGELAVYGFMGGETVKVTA